MIKTFMDQKIKEENAFYKKDNQFVARCGPGGADGLCRRNAFGSFPKRGSPADRGKTAPDLRQSGLLAPRAEG